MVVVVVLTVVVVVVVASPNLPMNESFAPLSIFGDDNCNIEQVMYHTMIYDLVGTAFIMVCG